MSRLSWTVATAHFQSILRPRKPLERLVRPMCMLQLGDSHYVSCQAHAAHGNMTACDTEPLFVFALRGA